MTTPAIPDSSDRVISLASGKRIQGATVPEWLQWITRNPDCSLPSGVGGALLAHFAERAPSPEFLAALQWHEHGKRVSPTAPSVLHTEAILTHYKRSE